jgi:hypothetical protein
MTDCCILVRYGDGSVHAIVNDDGNVMVWPDRDQAIREFEGHPFHDKMLWQLVELDEL